LADVRHRGVRTGPRQVAIASAAVVAVGVAAAVVALGNT
jgi:hypothetical protein